MRSQIRIKKSQTNAEQKQDKGIYFDDEKDKEDASSIEENLGSDDIELQESKLMSNFQSNSERTNNIEE